MNFPNKQLTKYIEREVTLGEETIKGSLMFLQENAEFISNQINAYYSLQLLGVDVPSANTVVRRNSLSYCNVSFHPGDYPQVKIQTVHGAFTASIIGGYKIGFDAFECLDKGFNKDDRNLILAGVASSLKDACQEFLDWSNRIVSFCNKLE